MLTIRDFALDPRSLGKKKLLVDVVPVHEYKDGQRTEKVIAHKYIVALPDKQLEKIGVKIDGEKLIDKPEGYVEVEFNGLELAAYEANGKVIITAKAGGITLAKPKA